MIQVIRNAHVYAPEDLGIQDVLIVNDKIESVKKSVEVQYENIKEIDGTGKILIPGLIDQHVHIIGGGGEDGFASQIREIQMSDCVMNGVTTVVGLLGTDGIVKSIEALVGRTKALKEQGMSAYCLTGSYAYPSTTITGSVSKDVALIDEIIGVKVAISDHRSSCITKQELARLASQVRTAALLAKKPGVVHMHTGRGKRGLKDVLEIIEETDLPISQFRPTHMSNQFEDAITFALKGGYIDFTAGEKAGNDIIKAFQLVDPKRITMSSDANGSMPIWDEDKNLIGMGVGNISALFETVKEMIAKGLEIGKAISVVTSNVADALLLPSGRIQEGKQADMILLDEELNIDTVIALGKTVVSNGLFTGKNYYSY